MKKAEILKNGLPDLTNARFITLTIDRKKFETPWEAFEHCKDQTRKFINKLRNWLNTDADY